MEAARHDILEALEHTTQDLSGTGGRGVTTVGA